ncbi:MAG: homocysteine S-methyltransferase family protein [Bryobacteraceae bacterium]
MTDPRPLEEALAQRVLVLNATAANPAWDAAFSPNLNLTHPGLVKDWSAELLRAGADILEANSYGADPFTAAEYGATESQRREWSRAAVSIAREANADHERYIAGVVGPSFDLLSLNARHSFHEHVEAFSEQIHELWAAGVDAIHLVHQPDSKNLCAALDAVARVEDEVAARIPVIITFDLTPLGIIVSGERPEDLSDIWEHRSVIGIGLATYGYGGETLRRLRDRT